MSDSKNEDTSPGIPPPRRQPRTPDLKWALRVTEERVRDVLVLHLAGRMSAVEADALEARLEAAIAAGERRLVVDMGALDYLSGRGIRLLESASAHLEALRGRLVLCAVTDPVRIVLELTGAVARLAIDSTQARALARAVQPAEQSNVAPGETA